ncbi:MAG: hypothetical protein ACTHNP_06540 [Solirubrobacterales bacterium]
MRVRQAAAAAFALAALVCFPAGAGARVGHYQPPAQRWIDFELESSNGYSIHVSVNPRRHLVMRVTKKGQTTAETFTAEYMTRDALAGAGRVKAGLLGRGSISVRFHPRGPVRHPLVPRCGRKRPRVQPGVVRGTIKFTGEGGYTQVEAREADAAIEEPALWYCRYGSDFEPHPGEGEWISKFSAWGEGAYLLARRYRPGAIEGGQVLYLAEAREALESTSGSAPRPVTLNVYRRLTIPAPASTFDDAHPEHLTVAPPPPFSGTAALARTPESVFTWEGDLSVQFPGLGPTPLAGPGFESSYCLREAGCFEQNLETPGPYG